MFSWLGFEGKVAIRFLREGRVQTVLIIVGVAAGVAVVAYISALVSGLQSNTFEKTLGTQAHITIKAPDDVVTSAALPQAGATSLVQTQPRAQRPRSVSNWQQLIPVLEGTPNIASVSPSVLGAGLAIRGEASKSIALTGVILERYDKIVNLRSKIVAGASRLEPGEGMIGRDLASDLGIRVGDRLVISTGINSSAVAESLRVTALLDFGVRELNRRTVIVPLRTAQNLIGLPGGVTNIDLTVKDVWAAQTLAAALSQRFAYKIESWQQTNAQLVSALNAQSVSTTLIRVIVMLVVVLGITSVLVVSVVQKRKEIGILRAMGATQAQIQRVFLLQGAIFGAIGSVLGVLLAVLLIWAFTYFVRGSDGLALFAITLPPVLAMQIALVATLCGVLAAVAPARRAAALDPALAIRI
jgi:lipoprotein-releasing system permease protein